MYLILPRLIANKFAAKGGLLLAEFLEIVEKINTKFMIVALAFTAYDPSYDKQNLAYDIVCKIVDAVVTG